MPAGLTPGPDFASGISLEPVAAIFILLIALGIYFLRHI